MIKTDAITNRLAEISTRLSPTGVDWCVRTLAAGEVLIIQRRARGRTKLRFSGASPDAKLGGLVEILQKKW